MSSGKGVTSINWVNGNDRQIRLYYQINDGNNLVEQSNGAQNARPGSNGWSDPMRINSANPVKGTDMAAITWDDSGSRQIRLYYHHPDGYIHETGYDGQSWGGDVQIVRADPKSSIDAVTWSQDGRQIRIYYVGSDGYPTETGYNGSGWTQSFYRVPNSAKVIQ